MNDLTHTQPRPLAKLLGVSAAASLLLFSVAMGGPLSATVDLPSLVFVGGLTAAILVGTHGFSGVFQSIRTLGFGGTKDDQELAIAFFMHAGGVAVCAGVMGSLLGYVQMLRNLSDPNTIGPAAAVALLTTLYGVATSIAAFSAAFGVSLQRG